MDFDKDLLLREEARRGQRCMVARRAFNYLRGSTHSLDAGGVVAGVPRPTTVENPYCAHIDREDCWDNLVSAYRQRLRNILSTADMKEKMSELTSDDPIMAGFFDAITRDIQSKWPPVVVAQIQRVAAILGITFLQVVMLQMVYEMMDYCTTFTYVAEDNGVHLGRCIEWPSTELKNIVVPVHIYVNGALVAKTMHWVGNIGFFSFVSPDYALGINYRSQRHTTVAAAVRTICKHMVGFKQFDQQLRKHLQDFHLVGLAKILDGHIISTILARRLLANAVPSSEVEKVVGDARLCSEVFITLVGNTGNVCLSKITEPPFTPNHRTPEKSFLVQPPMGSIKYIIYSMNLFWWSGNAGGPDTYDAPSEPNRFQRILENKPTPTNLWTTMKALYETDDSLVVETSLMTPKAFEMQYPH